MINIKGYDIPTNLSEMTIERFESLNQIMSNNDLLHIEKHIEYLETYIPDDIMLTITDDEIFKLIELINDKEDINGELIKSFELDGYTYVSHEDEFNVKAVELSFIEKRISKNPSRYFSYIISILFKRSDLTNKEHYTEAHLKYKEELFKKLNAKEFYPYVLWITEKLSKKLKTIYDKPSE